MKAQYKEDIPLPSTLCKDFPECKKMRAVWKTHWAMAEKEKAKEAEVARAKEAEVAEKDKHAGEAAKETLIVGDENSADEGMVTRGKKKAATIMESDGDIVEVELSLPKRI